MPQFDIMGAIKEGYSPKEIAAYMKEQGMQEDLAALYKAQNAPKQNLRPVRSLTPQESNDIQQSVVSAPEQSFPLTETLAQTPDAPVRQFGTPAPDTSIFPTPSDYLPTNDINVDNAVVEAPRFIGRTAYSAAGGLTRAAQGGLTLIRDPGLPTPANETPVIGTLKRAADAMKWMQSGEGSPLAVSKEQSDRNPVISTVGQVGESLADFGGKLAVSGGAMPIMGGLSGSAHFAESRDKALEGGASEQDATAMALPGAAVDAATFMAMPAATGPAKAIMSKGLSKIPVIGTLSQAANTVTSQIVADTAYMTGQGVAIGLTDKAAGISPEYNAAEQFTGKNMATTAGQAALFAMMHAFNQPKLSRERGLTPSTGRETGSGFNKEQVSSAFRNVDPTTYTAEQAANLYDGLKSQGFTDGELVRLNPAFRNVFSSRTGEGTGEGQKPSGKDPLPTVKEDSTVQPEPLTPKVNETTADTPPSELEVLQKRKANLEAFIFNTDGTQKANVPKRILDNYNALTATIEKLQAETTQEGVANGAPDILPEVQAQGTVQVDGAEVVVPDVQSGVAGASGDNVQSGDRIAEVEKLEAQATAIENFIKEIGDTSDPNLLDMVGKARANIESVRGQIESYRTSAEQPGAVDTSNPVMQKNFPHPEDVTPVESVIEDSKALSELRSKALAEDRKHYASLSRDELFQEKERIWSEENNTESNILGNDIQAWRTAQRRINSRNNDTVKQAEDEIERIESKLTEADRKKLYGEGEVGHSAEDLRDYIDAIDAVHGETPEELANSLKYAITKINGKTDPADMDAQEFSGYLQLREGMHQAEKNGWDTKDLSDKVISAAARRFSDPEDAHYMLKSFIKNAPKSSSTISAIENKQESGNEQAQERNKKEITPSRKTEKRKSPRNILSDIRKSGGINLPSIIKALDVNEVRGPSGKGNRYLRVTGKNGVGLDQMAQQMRDQGWNIPLDEFGKAEGQPFADMVRNAINGEHPVHPDDVERLTDKAAVDELQNITDEDIEYQSLTDSEREIYHDTIDDIAADLFDEIGNGDYNNIIAKIKEAHNEGNRIWAEIERSSLDTTEGKSTESSVSTSGKAPEDSRQPLSEVVSSSGEVQNKLFATPPSFGTKPQTSGKATATGDLLDNFTTDRPPALFDTPEKTKIDDFGEKIGGARKDYSAKFDHAKTLDIATEPFAKTWPEPDYKKLLADGFDEQHVSLVRALRDEIPDKPRQSWKLKDWVKLVESLRDHAELALQGKSPVLYKVLQETRFENSAAQNIAGRAELYHAVGHDVSLRGVTLKKNFYNLFKGEKDVTKWQIEVKQKASAFNNMPRELGIGNTKAEAIEDFKSRLSDFQPEAKTNKPTEFIVYSKRNEKGVFYVGKKMGKDYVDLETFPTAKEAHSYIKENRADLETKLVGVKNLPNERRESNSPRVGEDVRDGKPATPQMFTDAFGFRGVEFGNWVKGDERQQNLNEAFDALHDLAGVLNIPTQALSLNGELGLAFGARGKGGKRPAAAHYEPDRVVINLTKQNGAGSLAHEWFHAVDSYFSRQRGYKDDFITEHAVKYGPNDATRQELIDAFKKLNTALNDTNLKVRSRNLDKARTKDYWSTGIEMHARAFENYVIDKLAESNNGNDYLANIKGINEYAEDLLMGLMADKTVNDLYPYLLESEKEKVVKAFDNLFSTMQTKQTEKGTALFSLAKDHGGDTVKEEAARIEKIKEAQYVPERIPQDYNGAEIGSTLEDATSIARRSHEAVRRPEISGSNAWEKSVKYKELSEQYLRPAEEESLRKWATDKNLILDHEEFNREWEKQGRKGRGEHDIYLDADGLNYIKRNRLTFHDNILDFLNRLSIHAAVLPDTAYKLIGFHDYDGHLYPVVSQRFVPGRVSEYNESHNEMVELKLEPIVIGNAKPTSYRIGDTGIILRDPHGDNTRIDADGNVWVIDPVFDFDLDTKTDRLKAEAEVENISDTSDKKEEFGDEVDKALEGWDKSPNFSLKKKSAGIQKSDAQAVVDPLLKTWKNAPPVEVVQSEKDLPAGIVDQIHSIGAEGLVRGVFEEGKVFLIADNLHSSSQALEVLLHETVGHFGMRGLLGKQFDPILQQVIRTYGKKGLQDIAKRYGFDLNTEEGRKTAAEEKLAEMAETGEKPGFIKRVVAMIKEWLRKMGLDLKWTDADIKVLIAKARGWVERGKSFTIDKLQEERGSFSLRRTRTGDPAVDAVLDKIGAKEKTMMERIKESLGNLAHKQTRMRELEQGIFDKYASLRYLDKMAGVTRPDDSAYIAARMSTSLSDVMLAMLKHGHPIWKDGGSAVQGKGLVEIFKPVAEDLDQFLGWMVGERAQKLMNEGRERYFDQDEINLLKGLKTVDNGPRWELARREYIQYKRKVLDFAEESGVINPEARKIWDHEEYVPFYRIVEDKPKGPFNTKGLASQNSGVKTLKGADERLGDIFENIVRNFTHLVDASIKNRSTELSIQKAEAIGAASRAPIEWKAVKINNQDLVDAVSEYFGETQEEVDAFVNPEDMEAFTTFFHPAKPQGKDVIHVLRNGKPEYFQIHDDLLLRSLASINDQVWGGPAMQGMRLVKRILTMGVTSAPDFMIRNFLRDTLHTWTISRGKFTPMVSSVTGMVKAFRDDPDMVQLMAAGGAFHGGYAYGNDPAAAKLMVEKLLSKKSVDKNTLLNTPKKLWEFWQEIGGAMENAARVATYKNVRDKTGSHLQGAFEAKDIMDFSMRGDWAAVNFLTQTVPFFGARLQGLQRLGKGMLENPKAFTLKGALIAFAAVLLYLYNRNNPKFQELEEWDKDTYFHFFVVGKHFRLPKPFEVGAIFGTIPERMTELFLEKQHDGKLMANRLMNMLTQTFAVGLPQILNEPAQQWANKDFFTDRPIVSPQAEGMLPGEQHTPNTSATMQEIGKRINISPARLEHAVKGYFGTIGTYVLGASDVMTRRLLDYPAQPTTKPEDWPLLSSFYKGGGPARNTKFTTAFYELLKEVDQTAKTVEHLRQTGEHARADQLTEKEMPKLQVKRSMQMAQKQLSQINKQVRVTQLDRSMTPDEKRELLDNLQTRKNELSRLVVEQAKENGAR